MKPTAAYQVGDIVRVYHGYDGANFVGTVSEINWEDGWRYYTVMGPEDRLHFYVTLYEIELIARCR